MFLELLEEWEVLFLAIKHLSKSLKIKIFTIYILNE